MKTQKTLNSQNNLEREEKAGDISSLISNYYKATVIRTV